MMPLNNDAFGRQGNEIAMPLENDAVVRLAKQVLLQAKCGQFRVETSHGNHIPKHALDSSNPSKIFHVVPLILNKS